MCAPSWERFFESFFALYLSYRRRGLKTRFGFGKKMVRKSRHPSMRVPLEVVRRRLARYALSPREQQVVFLLVRGLSNKEIAGRCSLAAETVKGYLQRVYKKAGIHGRMALLAHLFGTDES